MRPKNMEYVESRDNRPGVIHYAPHPSNWGTACEGRGGLTCEDKASRNPEECTCEECLRSDAFRRIFPHFNPFGSGKEFMIEKELIIDAPLILGQNRKAPPATISRRVGKVTAKAHRIGHGDLLIKVTDAESNESEVVISHEIASLFARTLNKFFG